MKQQLFTVYDNKARAYQQIFMAPTLAAGMRAFSDVVQDPNTSLAKHPADYTLVQVGEFNENSGILTPKPGGPFPVASAKDFIPDQQQIFEDPAQRIEEITLENDLVNGEKINAAT